MLLGEILNWENLGRNVLRCSSLLNIISSWPSTRRLRGLFLNSYKLLDQIYYIWENFLLNINGHNNGHRRVQSCVISQSKSSKVSTVLAVSVISSYWPNMAAGISCLSLYSTYLILPFWYNLVALQSVWSAYSSRCAWLELATETAPA